MVELAEVVNEVIQGKLVTLNSSTDSTLHTRCYVAKAYPSLTHTPGKPLLVAMVILNSFEDPQRDPAEPETDVEIILTPLRWTNNCRYRKQSNGVQFRYIPAGSRATITQTVTIVG